MARQRICAMFILGSLLAASWPSWAESVAPSASTTSLEQPILQDAHWLIRQPDDRYLLQLVTLSTRSQLQDFADRAASQAKGTLATFRYQKANGLLYVLVLGVFQTAEEAVQAQLSLQIDGLTGEETWVRSLAEVKNSIRTTLQD